MRGAPYRQPKSIGGGETSPPDLGAHLWVHTRWGYREGIKRWGIEGIRIGTFDRFGRGRGEYNIKTILCYIHTAYNI